MFGLFESKAPKAHPHERGEDCVWINDEACHRGVLAEADERLK